MKHIKTKQLNMYVDIAGTDLIIFDKTYSLAYYIPVYGIEVMHKQQDNACNELLKLEYAYCNTVNSEYIDAVIEGIVSFLYVPAYAAD
jgi:hypothetical protein